MESLLKLFRALEIKEQGEKESKTILEQTIPKGFVFSPKVIFNYSEKELLDLIEIVEKEIGLSADKMNSSFHKSWAKVKDTPMEQLVVEQIAHYLTTYGKESPELYIAEKEIQWGVDELGRKISELPDFEADKVGGDYVYIPKEALEIPDLEIDKIQLVIIKGLTKEEIRIKLLALLNMGIALHEDTIKDIVEVALGLKITKEEIEAIKNKEVRIMMCDYLGIVPSNPIEFLRFLIYKATEKTLLIKSPLLIEEIRERNNIDLIRLFEQYEKENSLEKLSTIFYRFKPLFLAFRTNKQLKKIINKIRRLAKDNHKPMPEDYLNNITSRIKNDEKIDTDRLRMELDKVNIFRKIRLAYALKFRTKDVESILYRVRNGKGYATDFTFENKETAKDTLEIVLDSIASDLKVKGKKIYIPESINYTLPSTEKQFTGNFPSGTSILVPKDMIFGIYWDNLKGFRVDLDLSLISVKNGKIGWDSGYRSDSGDILFSGDMTDARRGASELFYVGRQSENTAILFVNFYNFEENKEVSFKIVVGEENISNLESNHMIDINNIRAITSSKINEKQKILGFAVIKETGCSFYFTETYLGQSISSSDSKFATHARQYLVDFYENSISLKDILVKAGAELADKENCEIDLSPETLEKDTILGLLIHS